MSDAFPFAQASAQRMDFARYIDILKPPFAHITLPVHHALSGVQSIAITPATSES